MAASWLDSAPDAHWLDEAPEAPAPPRMKTGVLPAIERGAAQGLSAGFLDELAGGIGATIPALSKIDPDLRQAWAGGADTWGERYQKLRDFYRAKNKIAKEDRPRIYGGSEIGGGIASAALGGGAKAVAQAPGLASRILTGAKAGLPMGALFGAGQSESDTVPGFAADTATGGLLGLATGGLLPVATTVLGKAAGPVAGWLRKRAIESGRKALSGIGTALSARKPIDESAVEQALQTGAIRPLSTVSGIAERLGGQADELGAEYGQILQRLEAQGVKGPNAILLAQKLSQEAKQAAQNSLGSARPTMLQAAADELPSKVNPAPFADKRLGLLQAEEIKRQLQQEAQREYNKITGQTTVAGDTKRELASTLRQEIENAVQDQASMAPEAAAQFEPVKQALSRTYEALNAAKEGAARAARRKHVSLTSTIVGGATGAASHSPGAGLAAALLHGIADKRLASTAASTQYGLSRLLGAAAQPMSPAAQAETSQIGALIAAMRAPRLNLSPMPAAAAEEESP